MEIKSNKCQMLKVLVIGCLLIVIPLLSTSQRSKYLYFILNILILLLGAEAGLLSFFLKKNNTFIDDDRQTTNIPPTHVNESHRETHLQEAHSNRIVEKRCSNVKPTPSIFFIGGGDEEEEREVLEEELFQRAETFIGNFYKQLKMQREESWKKLHDLYHHKAF